MAIVKPQHARRKHIKAPLPLHRRKHGSPHSQSLPQSRPPLLPKTLPQSLPSKHSPAVAAILANPIRFVPATRLTEEDEMVATLRPRTKTLHGDTPAQNRRRNRASHISGKWEFGAGLRPVGMTNSSGVECYRHSVIQCLLHLPKFGNWLVQDHLPEGCSVDGVRNCILCHLRTLYTVYWSESRSQVSVRKALNLVYNALKNLGWAAGGEFEQQDADEFLTFLLGAIALRVDEIRDVLDQYRNKDVMNLLFGIQLRSFLHCKCKKTAPSITLDTDRSIRVGLGKARAKGTLHEYVKAHMSDDIDDYQCDGCHKRVRVTRQSTIHEAPEVLILSLRRFATSGSGTRKDDRRVRFTQWLDLGAHVTHPATQRPLKYRLVATINHRAGRITEPRRGARGGSRQSGDSLNAGGHYITAARGWNGKWSMLDDERVTSIESDVAAWPEKSRPGFTPYVLLYTRVA